MPASSVSRRLSPYALPASLACLVFALKAMSRQLPPFADMQNPLRSEDAMFRFLIWLAVVVVALIVLVVILRAIF